MFFGDARNRAINFLTGMERMMTEKWRSIFITVQTSLYIMRYHECLNGVIIMSVCVCMYVCTPSCVFCWKEKEWRVKWVPFFCFSAGNKRKEEQEEKQEKD